MGHNVRQGDTRPLPIARLRGSLLRFPPSEATKTEIHRKCLTLPDSEKLGQTTSGNIYLLTTRARPRETDFAKRHTYCFRWVYLESASKNTSIPLANLGLPKCSINKFRGKTFCGRPHLALTPPPDADVLKTHYG